MVLRFHRDLHLAGSGRYLSSFSFVHSQDYAVVVAFQGAIEVVRYLLSRSF